MPKGIYERKPKPSLYFSDPSIIRVLEYSCSWLGYHPQKTMFMCGRCGATVIAPRSSWKDPEYLDTQQGRFIRSHRHCRTPTGILPFLERNSTPFRSEKPVPEKSRERNTLSRLLQCVHPIEHTAQIHAQLSTMQWCKLCGAARLITPSGCLGWIRAQIIDDAIFEVMKSCIALKAVNSAS